MLSNRPPLSPGEAATPPGSGEPEEGLFNAGGGGEKVGGGGGGGAAGSGGAAGGGGGGGVPWLS